MSPTEPVALFRSVGCEQCDYQGYRGRGGIMEILKMDPGARRAGRAARDGARDPHRGARQGLQDARRRRHPAGARRRHQRG
jgi:type II secretory ATPase GspE/PulE/Tfp pilus assembly ATPase PilB-like protein